MKENLFSPNSFDIHPKFQSFRFPKSIREDLVGKSVGIIQNPKLSYSLLLMAIVVPGSLSKLSPKIRCKCS